MTELNLTSEAELTSIFTYISIITIFNFFNCRILDNSTIKSFI